MAVNFANLSSPQQLSIFDTVLGSTTSPTQGAGAIGFAGGVAYAIGTAGFALLMAGLAVTDAPFGADYTGVTDATTAINACVAQAITNGQNYARVPPGTFLLSGSGVQLPAGFELVGAGRTCTNFVWTSTTMTGLSIATTGQCVVDGITFAAPLSCTAGGCISITGAGGSPNAFTQIRNCEFSNGFVQISTTNAYAMVIRDNYASGAVSLAMLIQNVVVPDAGDSTIDSNIISNLGAAAIGILQTSSGGLRIVNNKILGGTQGIALNVLAGAATSILLVNGNSIESSTAAGITLQFGSGSNFAIVSINGNEISQVPIGVSAPGSGSTVALTNLNINSNIISLGSTGTNGIIINNVSNFTCGLNTIIGNAGTPTGITIGGFSSQGRIGLNSIQGCPTKVSNGSGTTTVAPDWVQAGTAAVTCSTGLGSLFSGTAAVTFPVAFDAAPTVTCDPGSVSGGFSGWASSVTKTGFTLHMVSVTNGGAGTANYSATGNV